MIILLTGATHTGKTALAQKLLEKYKIPYLSIDHLKMGLFRSGLDRLSLFCPVQAVYGQKTTTRLRNICGPSCAK